MWWTFFKGRTVLQIEVHSEAINSICIICYLIYGCLKVLIVFPWTLNCQRNWYSKVPDNVFGTQAFANTVERVWLRSRKPLVSSFHWWTQSTQTTTPERSAAFWHWVAAVADKALSLRRLWSSWFESSPLQMKRWRRLSWRPCAFSGVVFPSELQPFGWFWSIPSIWVVDFYMITRGPERFWEKS